MLMRDATVSLKTKVNHLFTKLFGDTMNVILLNTVPQLVIIDD